MDNSRKTLSLTILVSLSLVLASLACNSIIPEDNEDPTPSEISEGGIDESGVPDLIISTGHAGVAVTGSCLEEYVK